MPNPTTTSAWKSLTQLTASPAPSGQFSMEAAGIYADFSRQPLSGDVRSTLLALCREQGLEARREAMLAGAAINTTEGRPVLHTALRSRCGLTVDGRDVDADVAAQLQRMRSFVEGVRGGRTRSVTEQRFTDVVSIGIGGSSLGPQLVCTALAHLADGPRVHFVSNIDGAHLADTLAHLNPAGTLVMVMSKTFTTDETMTNANSARKWLTVKLGADAFATHFVAITANPAEAQKQGYAADRTFAFWNWVGGRYSLWSTVGMPVAMAGGYEAFAQLLAGAAAMDEHFRISPLEANLPVALATVGLLNRNFHGMGTHAVLPYAQRIALLPKYLQQLEMESNGKSVDLDGRRVNYATSPVIFGEPGTDGQHSFHQLLHQGTDRVSVDIIAVAKDSSKLSGHHAKLLANAIAQADAMWTGSRSPEPHRNYEGGRPVTVLLLPEADAFHLGALIALYEHKVFVQGVLWNINSFDQWGVELGKKMANSLRDLMGSASSEPPPHLARLVARLRAMSRPE
jgi:glucose-6-phosphate isomerase